MSYSDPSNDYGIPLPTFSGDQSDYLSWHTKWICYLRLSMNEEGRSLLYVIEDEKEPNAAAAATLLKGKQFDRDNFRVGNLLMQALVDGHAHVYATKHEFDGRSGYLALHGFYQSPSTKEAMIYERLVKLRTLCYRGAKNFDWDKFGMTLHRCYRELAALGEPVSKKTQIRNLLPMIQHEKTKQFAVDIIFACDIDNEDLNRIMMKIDNRMSLWKDIMGYNNDGPINNQQKRRKAEAPQRNKRRRVH